MLCFHHRALVTMSALTSVLVASVKDQNHYKDPLPPPSLPPPPPSLPPSLLPSQPPTSLPPSPPALPTTPTPPPTLPPPPISITATNNTKMDTNSTLPTRDKRHRLLQPNNNNNNNNNSSTTFTNVRSNNNNNNNKQGLDGFILSSKNNEYCLMQDLMSGYDPKTRPVYDPHDAVDVTLGLTLKKILDLDEKNQILTTNIWLEASWYDQRLNWSSVKYGGIKSVLIPPHKIWLPDIVLYNSVDDYTSGYMPSLAMVYNDSRVFWGPVIRFRSACKIDITYFPFDTQMCRMKLGSWAYTGLQVDLWNKPSNQDYLTNFHHNGEWELLAVKQKRNIVFYACCPEPFPDVTFTIVLRRKTTYYFMNILIPCILLSFLCLAGFLLPPDSGEKVTLGLSVLLTITVFMLMVADRMPHTSESISLISIYLMLVLSTSCMSVLSSVLVIGIHNRKTPKKVPACLRWLCCFGMTCRRLLCCPRKPAKTVAKTKTRLLATLPQNCGNKMSYSNDDKIISQVIKHSKTHCIVPESGTLLKDDNDDDDGGGIRIRQILSKYSRGNNKKKNNNNSSNNNKIPFMTVPVTFTNNSNDSSCSHQDDQNLDSEEELPEETSSIFQHSNSSSNGAFNITNTHEHPINSSPANCSLTNCMQNNYRRRHHHHQQQRKKMFRKHGNVPERKSSDDNFVLTQLIQNEQQQQQQQQHQQPEQHHHHNDEMFRRSWNILELESCEGDSSSNSDVPEETETISNNNHYDNDVIESSACVSASVTQLASLIVEKERDEMETDNVLEEWHDLAKVLDRVLFAVFLTLMIISTACILQLRPSQADF